jgi:hypothetical protein
MSLVIPLHHPILGPSAPQYELLMYTERLCHRSVCNYREIQETVTTLGELERPRRDP